MIAVIFFRYFAARLGRFPYSSAAQGENVDRLSSRIASIAGSIGFLPLIIFEWACNVAMVVLLPRGFAYLIAPERITAWLDVQLTCSA
jgi:hypothetical protein